LLQNRDTIGARVVRVAVCRVVEKTIGCGADERSSNGSRLTGRGSGDNRTRCLLTGSGSGWDASEVQRIENASEVTELQRENKSPTIQREFVSGSIGTVK